VLAVAVGWTVYGIHHRPFDLGLVGLVLFAPSLLLVFVAGHAVDRFDRKRIVVLAAIGVAVCAFALRASRFAHVQNLALMLGVLFFHGRRARVRLAGGADDLS
jgi:MFS family permease